MQEKILSEKESLALISEMISKAKNLYYESGLVALLWGFTNVICFSLAYMDATIQWFNLPFNPFYLMGITIILQVYFDQREKRFQKAITYKDEAHKYVWTTFGISILILTIAGSMANMGYSILPFLLLLFAIPTFISGCINKFKPMIIGGISCWALCIISFFFQGYFTYLLIALGAVMAWIIPGFILRKRFYKNIANQSNGV